MLVLVRARTQQDAVNDVGRTPTTAQSEVVPVLLICLLLVDIFERTSCFPGILGLGLFARAERKQITKSPLTELQSRFAPSIKTSKLHVRKVA